MRPLSPSPSPGILVSRFKFQVLPRKRKRLSRRSLWRKRMNEPESAPEPDLLLIQDPKLNLPDRIYRINRIQECQASSISDKQERGILITYHLSLRTNCPFPGSPRLRVPVFALVRPLAQSPNRPCSHSDVRWSFLNTDKPPDRYHPLPAAAWPTGPFPGTHPHNQEGSVQR